MMRFMTTVWLFVSLNKACTSQMFMCAKMGETCSHEGDTTTPDTDARVSALEEKVAQLQRIVQNSNTTVTTIDGFPRDCGEIYQSGVRTDGVHAISPDGRCPFFVYCDMTNGGWTLIQRRINGSVNFYRTWDEYVQGFGDIDGEHWLGLEKIHRLTAEGSQIYFDMNMWDDRMEYAHYKVFTVHGAATAYRMNVDAFGYDGSIKELLSYHDNMKFSTFDRDNDATSSNCCLNSLDGGGWWYKSCYRLGNVNGVYGKQAQGGIGYWDTSNIAIKTTLIKVRAIDGVC